jgi:hypothetical protein
MLAKTKVKISIVLVVIMLTGMACSLVDTLVSDKSKTPATPSQDQGNLPSQPDENQQQGQEPVVDYPKFQASDVYLVSFADYPAEYGKLPPAFQGGYGLPADLAQIKGIDKIELTNQQKDVLVKNGFVIQPPKPGEYREFYQVYESLRYTEDEPVFITTDAAFHIYHLIFDKMLRDLERQFFVPYLKRLTQSMTAACLAQYQQLAGTPLEEPALRNLAYFSVAGQLLGLADPVPAPAADLVNKEVSLINAHASPAISPTWDRPDLSDEMKLIEDYTLYVPRGHYTREEALSSYFKAMTWYGRMTFRLDDIFETRRALLLVQALRNAPKSENIPAQQLWENIYSPTAFIVGKSDDLSSHEYGVVSDAVFGATPDLQKFGDDAQMQRFSQAAKNLPPPQINSMWVWIWQDRDAVTQGMRFMGQRFTLDAYIFGQLMWRKVGSMENPRDLPKGLDIFAAMGSNEAKTILDEMKQGDYQNYATQMEKMRKEVSGLEADSWTQSLYWAWLYAFQPLIAEKGEQFPPFMRSKAWQRKELNTALGSWTELKHDTVLYAKQVMAEMGGGGGDEKPLHGYVEPNPEVYARMLSLTHMTEAGLRARGLTDDTTRGNLENLAGLLTFLKASSEKLLNGEVLTDDDYWRIVYFGGELEGLTLAAADKTDENDRDLQDRKAALITDVATGIDRILLEGIGQPTRIYVILPDEPFRIGTGAVFTTYEFEAPLDQRMTDEDWQAKVESGQTPPMAPWLSTIVSP